MNTISSITQIKAVIKQWPHLHCSRYYQSIFFSRLPTTKKRKPLITFRSLESQLRKTNDGEKVTQVVQTCHYQVARGVTRSRTTEQLFCRDSHLFQLSGRLTFLSNKRSNEKPFDRTICLLLVCVAYKELQFLAWIESKISFDNSYYFRYWML